jgi:murein DD-endopeptidase MepM/ murein hydrolase activator NlpD
MLMTWTSILPPALTIAALSAALPCGPHAGQITPADRTAIIQTGSSRDASPGPTGPKDSRAPLPASIGHGTAIAATRQHTAERIAWWWPLSPAPRVLRGFEPPAHRWEAGHRGVDLAAAPGRPVYSSGPGRVGFARDLAGRGVVTVIHGTLRTTYLPVDPVVRPGQLVALGSRIGRVEAVPPHDAHTPCLHWGLLRGATYLDPLSLLGLGPVRLLPWWGTPARSHWP